MMVVSMSRLLSWLLTVSLTLTPAVVGACAALVCAPDRDGVHIGHHAAIDTAHAGGHPGHVQPDAHAGHHEHQAPVAARVLAEASLEAVAAPDCCTLAASREAVVAVVTGRHHGMTAPDVLTGVAPHAMADPRAPRQPSPTERLNVPPQPAVAPLVLRL